MEILSRGGESWQAKREKKRYDLNDVEGAPLPRSLSLPFVLKWTHRSSGNFISLLRLIISAHHQNPNTHFSFDFFLLILVNVI